MQDQQKGHAEQFLTNFVSAQKCIQLYPAKSPMIDGAMTKLVSGLDNYFRTTAEPVVLGVIRDQFLDGRTVVGSANDSIKRFAAQLYRAQVKMLIVSPGVTAAELRRFLALVCLRPEEIQAAGGLAAQMATLNLDHILIEEAAELQLVDRDRKSDEWDILDYLRNRRSNRDSTAKARGLHGEDRSKDFVDAGELAEFFNSVAEGSPEMARYLRNTLGDPARLAETLNCLGDSRQRSENESGADSLRSLKQAFRQIAEAIASSPEAVRIVYAKNMAKALVETRAPVRKRFIENVLPAQVGQFSQADLIIASLKDETVADVLTNHAIFHKGTWRTIENFLAGISDDTERGAVIKEAMAANLAYSNEQRIRQIATLLADRESPVPAQGIPAKPASVRPRDTVVSRFEELSKQLRPEGFEAENMCRDVVEDCTANASLYAMDLALLLQNQREFGVFAESTSQLLALSLQASFEQKRYDLTAHVLEQARDHDRLIPGLQESCLARFVTDERLDAMVDALRNLDPAAAEYNSIVNILRLSGDRAFLRLFDRMVGEPDRPSRIFLLQLFIHLGNSVTGFLGEKISHPGWFVVRNIVYVLGKVATESAVETLTRVLDHPEARVRSELVQALGTIGGDKVENPTLKLLADSDPSVADQAAGYLEQFDTERVLPALRTMLITDRKSLHNRPYVAGKIMCKFAETGGKEDLKLLSDFRPSRLRFYSRPLRAITRDCKNAMRRIREREKKGSP